MGHLLFVDWDEILKVTVLYSLIGSVHWGGRHRFLTISRNPEEAFRKGWNIRAWDFLFYATFGFVVTSSVEMAGVLLVFSFLVVPAVCAVRVVRRLQARLVVGWVVGILASVVGILFSYFYDLPTGATVVCTFGPALIFSFIIKLINRK